MQKCKNEGIVSKTALTVAESPNGKGNLLQFGDEPLPLTT